MTTALDQVCQEVDTFSNDLVANVKQVIVEITTDGKSEDESIELIDKLMNIQDSLFDLSISVEDVNEKLKFCNKIESDLNKLFTILKIVIDGSDECNLTNDHTYKLLANLEKAKSIIGEIKEYIKVFIDINSSEEPYKQYSVADLISSFDEEYTHGNN